MRRLFIPCTMLLFIAASIKPATIRIYNQTREPIKGEIVYKNDTVSYKKTIQPSDYRLFDSSLSGIKLVRIYEDSGKRDTRTCSLANATDGKVTPGYIPLKVLTVYQIPVDLGALEVEKKLYFNKGGVYTSNTDDIGSGKATIIGTTQEEGSCEPR